jgi:DNA-binding NarL/FixJ family response regulator
MRPISVLVVDDHTVFAEAVAARLSSEHDMRPVRIACSAAQARHDLGACPPDVVVLDMALGDGNGLDLIGHARRVAPGACIVVLSATEPPASVAHALRGGARAWLAKTVDPDRLVRVIRGVTRGEAWFHPDLLGRVLADLTDDPQPRAEDRLAVLSTREREVLQCMVDGLARSAAAVRLRLSPNTVRTHMQNLSAKLGTHSAVETVAVARRHGMRQSNYFARHES